MGLRTFGALLLPLYVTLALAQKPASTAAPGLAERRLAGVDIQAGRYKLPADLHQNAVMMENDSNGSGGGDESVEWDTPACHVRVLSRYADPKGPRTTYSATVTRPEDQPAVSKPEPGSCATFRGVGMGDAGSKAIAAYGSRVTITPGKHPQTTLLHWEWQNGTVLEITLDAKGLIVGLDLTGNVE